MKDKMYWSGLALILIGAFVHILVSVAGVILSFLDILGKKEDGDGIEKD